MFVQSVGWLPFMALAIYTSRYPQYGAILLVIGLVICFVGVIMGLVFNSKDFYRTIDELREERARYEKARMELERKTAELIKKL